MRIQNRKFKIQKGFVALYLTILVLALVFGIVVSIYLLTLNQQKILRNITRSTQSYYLAEAGIEDALLRLKKKMNFSSPYSFKLGNGTTTVEISDIIGGSRTINSRGNISNTIKKIQVVYAISKQKVSFYYGAQVGAGGLIMGNGSRVLGNVYSNGSVTGAGTIQNSIIVAGNGNRIEGITVGEDATVFTCKNSIINGNLIYVSGGSVQNCQVKGSTSIRPNEIPPRDLPISQSQIDKWKEESANGGVTTTDISISGTKILGPIQIGTSSNPKNLTVQNGATLIVKGTIYVTGNITFSNGSTIKLDSSYGSLSGIIISDGVITVENNVTISGSGQPGSYVLILSTKSDTTNPVIDIRNNSAGSAIYYANSGLIYLKNNMVAREVTGYKIQIENNAEIQYESGLEEANFSSGPGGSWEIVSWREIE
jgi:cytoskeletal protein CcmA (bactofilin family)